MNLSSYFMGSTMPAYACNIHLHKFSIPFYQFQLMKGIRRKSEHELKTESVRHFRLILHTNDLAAFATAKWQIFHIAEMFACGPKRISLIRTVCAGTGRTGRPQLPFDGSLKFLLCCCCSCCAPAASIDWNRPRRAQ